MSQTIARALEIVSLLSRGRHTLGEVGEHLGVHKSTALRMLRTLEEGGFVRRGEDGRYGMGFEMIALGQLALDQLESRAVAHEVLRDLAHECGHTVHLGQRIGDRVVYVDKVSGQGTVAMGSRIGLAALTHTAAVAKVVAAFQPADLRERMIAAASFEEFTPTTITGPAALAAELDRVRGQGWAEDDGEHEDYINCVALPVRDVMGRVTHGVSVTALKAVASLEDLRGSMDRYRVFAEQISFRLGWKGPGHEHT